MTDITELLRAVQNGKTTAAEELFSAMYDELRAIAASRLAKESPGQTLQPTALVHEAWVKLALWTPQTPLIPGASADETADAAAVYADRQHFLAVATQAMRQILVDVARRKKSTKAGGNMQKQAVDLNDLSLPGTPDEVLAVNDVLQQLAQIDPLAAQVVNYRYFVGMTIPETAAAMDISPRSADRLWAYARAWMKSQLDPD